MEIKLMCLEELFFQELDMKSHNELQSCEAQKQLQT